MTTDVSIVILTIRNVFGYWFLSANAGIRLSEQVSRYFPRNFVDSFSHMSPNVSAKKKSFYGRQKENCIYFCHKTNGYPTKIIFAKLSFIMNNERCWFYLIFCALKLLHIYSRVYASKGALLQYNFAVSISEAGHLFRRQDWVTKPLKIDNFYFMSWQSLEKLNCSKFKLFNGSFLELNLIIAGIHCHMSPLGRIMSPLTNMRAGGLSH